MKGIPTIQVGVSVVTGSTIRGDRPVIDFKSTAPNYPNWRDKEGNLNWSRVGAYQRPLFLPAHPENTIGPETNHNVKEEIRK